MNKKSPTGKQFLDEAINLMVKKQLKEENEQEFSREEISDYKEACLQIKKFADNLLNKIEAAKLDKHSVRVTAMNLKQYGEGWLKVVGR